MVGPPRGSFATIMYIIAPAFQIVLSFAVPAWG